MAEQIITKLREVDVLVAPGPDGRRGLPTGGIAKQTLYRWRKEYGGLKVELDLRMKDLERKNFGLK